MVNVLPLRRLHIISVQSNLCSSSRYIYIIGGWVDGNDFLWIKANQKINLTESP